MSTEMPETVSRSTDNCVRDDLRKIKHMLELVKKTLGKNHISVAECHLQGIAVTVPYCRYAPHQPAKPKLRQVNINKNVTPKEPKDPDPTICGSEWASLRGVSSGSCCRVRGCD